MDRRIPPAEGGVIEDTTVPAEPLFVPAEPHSIPTEPVSISVEPLSVPAEPVAVPVEPIPPSAMFPLTRISKQHPHILMAVDVSSGILSPCSGCLSNRDAVYACLSCSFAECPGTTVREPMVMLTFPESSSGTVSSTDGTGSLSLLVAPSLPQTERVPLIFASRSLSHSNGSFRPTHHPPPLLGGL